MATHEDSAEGAAPKKSKAKLFIIIGLVLLLAAGGAGAWFFMHGKQDKHEEVEIKPPVFLPLETFTVNLHGSDQYLQTDITLQVADQEQVDAIKLNMPRVRSRLLVLLSSKSAENLSTPEDKKTLAKEVKDQVALPFNPKGKPQKVDDVLFTTFVIQ